MIACLGDLLDDIVVWPLMPPRVGTDTPAQVHHRRGGSAANVASMVARRGQKARFIGCVGSDNRGERLIDELRSDGVDLCVTRDPKVPTGSIVVVVDANGDRSFFTDRGASIQLMDFQPSWLAGVSALHIPAYSFTAEPISMAAMSAVLTAKNLGIPVTIDASSTGALSDMGIDHFMAILQAVKPQVLLANRDEATVLGLKPQHGAPGVATTIISQDTEPTIIVSADGHTEEVPVSPVDNVVDTTGAGDAFAAGWLIASQAGDPPKEAVAHGHTLAALVLGHPGADLPRSPN